MPILVTLLIAFLIGLPLLYIALALVYARQRRSRIARGLPPDAGEPLPEPPSPTIGPQPEDPLSRLGQSLKDLPPNPSSRPYGQEYAETFAQWLAVHRHFIRSHPYAACNGFELRDDGTIVYGEYSDGFPFATLQTFDDLPSFAKWLALQSDQSLYQSGCECVSRSRMQKALQSKSYFGY